MERCIRILMVDEQRLFRESLKFVLGGEPDLKVVAGCESASQALEMMSSVPAEQPMLCC